MRSHIGPNTCPLSAAKVDLGRLSAKQTYGGSSVDWESELDSLRVGRVSQTTANQACSKPETSMSCYMQLSGGLKPSVYLIKAVLTSSHTCTMPHTPCILLPRHTQT